eukprot:g9849.t1
MTARSLQITPMTCSAALARACEGHWQAALALLHSMMQTHLAVSGIQVGALLESASSLGKPQMLGLLKMLKSWAKPCRQKDRSLEELRVQKLDDSLSRLDWPTSGLLLAAKGTPASETSWWFLAQFAGRLVSKRYLCLVAGDAGAVGHCEEIAKPLQVVKGTSSSSVEVLEEGITCLALYGSGGLASQPAASLLLAEPLTGRTHQLRAHLAHVGWPIVGDATYAAEGHAAEVGVLLVDKSQLLNGHCTEVDPAWLEEVSVALRLLAHQGWSQLAVVTEDQWYQAEQKMAFLEASAAFTVGVNIMSVLQLTPPTLIRSAGLRISWRDVDCRHAEPRSTRMCCGMQAQARCTSGLLYKRQRCYATSSVLSMDGGRKRRLRAQTAHVVALGRQTQWPKALEILQQSHSEADEKLYTAVCGALERASAWQQVLRLHGRALETVQHDERFLGLACSACSKGRAWRHALSLAVETGLQRPETANALLTLFMHFWPGVELVVEVTGLLDCYVIRRVISGILKITVIAPGNPCGALTDQDESCLDYSGQWQLVLQILSQLPELDVVAFGCAISACARAAQWRHATALLWQSAEVADEVTLGAAVSACDKGHEWQMACALLLAMPQHLSLVAINSEYTDAVEDLDSGPLPESPALLRDVASAQAAELSQFRERLSQMEGLLRAQGTMPAPKVQAAPRSMLDASGLDGTELTSTELRALQQLAGTAPKRLGKQEDLVPAPTLPTLEEQMLAEVDREVAIGDHQDSTMLTLESQIAQTSDPTQRLLLLQMRQTSDLLKTLLESQEAYLLSLLG